MSGPVIVDASEIRGLADDLRNGYREAAVGVRAVVSKGALNVKRDWQRQWTGLHHAPRLAAAVGYDVSVTRYSVTATIGPDKNKPQGALGNIIEYGTVKNTPKPGGGPAAEREAPRFENAISALAAGLLP